MSIEIKLHGGYKAVVRNSYRYNGDDIVWLDGMLDFIVYSDANNEDFTHDFTIPLYQDD